MTITSLPLWLPAVFVLLIGAGTAQARTRVVRPGTAAVLAAAFLAFSLYGVTAAFGLEPAALAAWSAGIAAALATGDRVFVPRGLAHADGGIRVPGSWTPLTLMMTIFAVKTALGFAFALRWPVAHAVWFESLAAFTLGLASGGFTARAAALRRFASRREAVTALRSSRPGSPSPT